MAGTPTTFQPAIGTVTSGPFMWKGYYFLASSFTWQLHKEEHSHSSYPNTLLPSCEPCLAPHTMGSLFCALGLSSTRTTGAVSQRVSVAQTAQMRSIEQLRTGWKQRQPRDHLSHPTKLSTHGDRLKRREQKWLSDCPRSLWLRWSTQQLEKAMIQGCCSSRIIKEKIKVTNHLNRNDQQVFCLGLDRLISWNTYHVSVL